MVHAGRGDALTLAIGSAPGAPASTRRAARSVEERDAGAGYAICRRLPAGGCGARRRLLWAAKLGLRLAYLDGAVTALWPPVGVGIGALTLFGPGLWPGVVVGDLLVGDYSTPLGTVLGQATGNTLEVLIAALLLRRLVGGGVGLTRVVQVLALVGCAAVGTFVSACFGSASLRLGNVITAEEFAGVWRTWWLSDFSGALVVAPVILSWANPGPFRLGRWGAVEGVALLTVL